MSRERGQIYENIAADYLQQQGLSLITRNFQCKAGELDLVCLDNKTLVFVEVKFRKNSLFGSALEMVSVSKQKKLVRTAELFLLQNRKYRAHPCRFDVFAITGYNNKQQSEKLDWIKNAFLIT